MIQPLIGKSENSIKPNHHFTLQKFSISIGEL